MGSIQKEVKECGRVLWKELQLSSWERQGCGHCFLSIFFLFPPLCLTKPFQFSSVAQPCPTLCDPINRSTPGLPVHHQLPEFTQTHVHWVGDAIQPSHPLSSPSPLAPNPSQHQSFPLSQLCMRWPKYWSFSFSIIPSKEHPGLISFRMDWLDLLVVQGTLKSLLNTTVQKHQFFVISSRKLEIPREHFMQRWAR